MLVPPFFFFFFFFPPKRYPSDIYVKPDPTHFAQERFVQAFFVSIFFHFFSIRPRLPLHVLTQKLIGVGLGQKKKSLMNAEGRNKRFYFHLEIRRFACTVLYICRCTLFILFHLHTYPPTVLPNPHVKLSWNNVQT